MHNDIASINIIGSKKFALKIWDYFTQILSLQNCLTFVSFITFALDISEKN